jgi:FkbM family methyltransferase
VEKSHILFGAGKIGKNMLTLLGGDAVFCFCDNYLSGTQVYGKDVISFDELRRIHRSYNVVLTAESGEMAGQLEAAGIPYELGHQRLRSVHIESGNFRKIENEGLFTDEFAAFVRTRKPKVFANVGAAGGGYASIAAHFMEEDARIYLFEPVPRFLGVLGKFFNRDARVRIIDKAVSNAESTLELFATVKPNQSNIAHSFTMDRDQTMFRSEYSDECEVLKHTAETVVLDVFFKDIDVDLMLMDIEGAEVLAIEGMEKLIAKRKTTFFLEVHEPYIKAIRADGLAYINSIFKKYGYRIYWCELTENGDYESERGGVRLAPSDEIKWEHCIVSPNAYTSPGR